MSKVTNLKGDERLEVGKVSSKALKANKRIPAIIYGKGKYQVMFSLEEKEITTCYNVSGFMSHIFDIEVGKSKYRAIPKDIQLDPVSDRIIHADFLHVSDNDKVKTNVKLSFLNKDKCIGIKHGGVLNVVKREVEVLAKVSAMPEKIEIDLSKLDIGDTVQVKDLKLPEGSEIVLEDKVTVATITGRKVEKEASSETNEESQGDKASSE